MAAVEDVISFEGVLLLASDYPDIECGILYVHQVAKYEVVHVFSGKYVGRQIVVDHPACEGDIFTGLVPGDHIRLTVKKLARYSVITTWEGIRAQGEKPKTFYVAQGRPSKVSAGTALNLRKSALPNTYEDSPRQETKISSALKRPRTQLKSAKEKQRPR